MENAPDIASLQLEAIDMMQDIEMAQAGFIAPQVEPIHLSREQRHVLDMVKGGKNVFFTGSAGAGKSVLLREIIRFLRSDAERKGWDRHSVAVTASTGIAAINIGGGTLHSWAGVTLGHGPVEELLRKLWASHGKRKLEPKQIQKFPRLVSNKLPDIFRRDERLPPTAIERWRLTRVLIIDEGRVWTD